MVYSGNMVGIAVLLSLSSTNILAAGFQTSFHSATSLSRGLGGAGVQGDDMADIYYNPAGTTLYSNGQKQGYLMVGDFSNRFTNTGSTQTLNGITLPGTGQSGGIDESVVGMSYQYTAPSNSNSSAGGYSSGTPLVMIMSIVPTGSAADMQSNPN